MPTRLTRAERREQVRTDLLAAAQEVFPRRGFHQATLEEIAAEAGWSKGAVFSNFAGKDDLFLAVLAERNRTRIAAQTAAARRDGTLAAGLVAAGREWADTTQRDPRWTSLLVEFWTHAARDDDLRARASALHEELLDVYADLIEDLAARDDIELLAPAKDIARSAASLGRGLTLERLLDPDAVSPEQFEQLFSRHVLSFTRPRRRSGRANGARR